MGVTTYLAITYEAPPTAQDQACLASGAEIVCSGFLESEVENLRTRLQVLNWRPAEWLSENEWSASLLRAGPE